MPYIEALEIHDAPAWLRTDPESIPMIPAVAQQALKMLHDPEVSLAALAQLVSREQVLASRLLAFANSAYFATRQQISRIRDAVVMAGAAGVRNIVVAASFGSRLFETRVYGDQAGLLMDHAIGAAYLARLIAEHLHADPDDAFLVGLLHDVGKLAVLKAAYDHRLRHGTTIDPSELDEAVVRHHAEAGAQLLGIWGVPPAVREPVRFHHAPRVMPGPSPLARVVYLADCLCHEYGFGCTAEACTYDDPAWEAFGVDPEWRASIEPRARGLFEVARNTLLSAGGQ